MYARKHIITNNKKITLVQNVTGLAIGQGVLIVYSVTRVDKGGAWIFFMIAPSILLLLAGFVPL